MFAKTKKIPKEPRRFAEKMPCALLRRCTDNQPVDDVMKNIAERFLASTKLRCKPATYSKYKNLYYKHIHEAVGGIKISALQTQNIRKIIDEKQDLSPKTLSDLICLVRLICDFGKSEGYETKVDFKSLCVHQNTPKYSVLPFDDQKRLISFLVSNLNLINLGIILSLFSGVRIGELCALQRKNISLENKTLTVNGTMQRLQVDNMNTKTMIIIGEPKSRSSVREIPLTDYFVGMARRLYSDLDDDCYLLSGRSDKFVEPRALQYHFKKILKCCEINEINFHALRHTFATRCVESDFEIKTLSEILGHNSVNITLNRYVHSSMELKRRNMEKIEELILSGG